MPEMNGKDLRDILQVIRPEMKVIFMSGYSADIISQQGVLEEGVHFLSKPVSFETLTSKVREVLDSD
jgi:FixJ family two-component response regulator